MNDHMFDQGFEYYEDEEREDYGHQTQRTPTYVYPTALYENSNGIASPESD